jgi:type VI protein secretion system component Hcp
MPNDVYVKFGDCEDYGGPLNTELPDIEGDSTDAIHYWWCELRECGFDMEAAQEDSTDGGDGDGGSSGGSGGSNSDKPASTFKAVKLTKRVDWASTQLFLKCCQAAMATTTKTTDDDATGRINTVTVEVCRPISGEYFYRLKNGSLVASHKVPCATVKYSGVRIIRYELNISTPEPSEVITFEFDKMQYKYLQTDPATGEVVDDQGQETGWLDNHHPEAKDSKEKTSTGGSTSGSSGSSGSGSSGNGQTATPASAPTVPGAAPEATVAVNFPGLWQGTGFGLLPD